MRRAYFSSLRVRNAAALRSEPAADHAKSTLNRASRYRVALGDANPEKIPAGKLLGLDVVLPGSPKTRRFLGDEHVWCWYRGAGVGPYPCMSALFALERGVDSLIAKGMPFSRVASTLLEGCESLAIPALLVGVFVRHLPASLGALRPWLVNPVVWRLELRRSSAESPNGHGVRAPDEAGGVGREWRGSGFWDVACSLAGRAAASGNAALSAELQDIAGELLRNGEDLLRSGGRGFSQHPLGDLSDFESDDRFVDAVARWAPTLCASSYRVTRTAEGTAVEYVMPADLAERRDADPATSQLLVGMRRRTIAARYMLRDTSSWAKTVHDDIAFLREHSASDAEDLADPAGPLSAAAALLGASGMAQFAPEQLDWVVDELVRLSGGTDGDMRSFEFSALLSPARFAAIGLTHLLALPAGLLAQQQVERVAAALDGALARGEAAIGREAVIAAEAVWARPCQETKHGCVHRRILGGLERLARACLVPRWKHGESKPRARRLGGDLLLGLTKLRPGDFLPERLAPLLIGAVAAEQARCCVAVDAARVSSTVLAKYRAGILHDEGRRGLSSDDEDALVARALVDAGSEVVLDHLACIAEFPRTLGAFLRNLAQLATIDHARRARIRAYWPAMLAVGVRRVRGVGDRRSDRFWTPGLVAGLLPVPIRPPRVTDDTAAEQLLQEARQNWVLPQEIAAQMPDWLNLAAGNATAADALIAFLWMAPPGDQGTWLPWVATLVQADALSLVGTTSKLVPWLAELAAAARSASTNLQLLRQTIDLLVGAGESRLVEVQERLER